MAPTHFYPRKSVFLLAALFFLPLGILSLPLAVADGADEILVFFFIPFFSLVCLTAGILFLIQGLSNNPMLSITEEGVYVRLMPSFKPLFSPWSEIWAVKMASNFGGKDVVVILVKNPQLLMAGVQGFIPKNHARNSYKMFGSPMVLRCGYAYAEPVPVFKLLYEEIEKRKNNGEVKIEN